MEESCDEEAVYDYVDLPYSETVAVSSRLTMRGSRGKLWLRQHDKVESQMGRLILSDRITKKYKSFYSLVLFYAS